MKKKISLLITVLAMVPMIVGQCVYEIKRGPESEYKQKSIWPEFHSED
jgi:hypothetical protein